MNSEYRELSVDSSKSKGILSSKLTRLEHRWYKEYLRDFDGLEAMRRVKKEELAGGLISQEVIYSLSHQTKKSCLKKLQITDDDVRRQMGIVKEKLDKRLLSKLDAKKDIVLGLREGKPQVVKIEDNQTQMKALELAYKLIGDLNDKLDVNADVKKEVTIRIVEDTLLRDVHEGEVVE